MSNVEDIIFRMIEASGLKNLAQTLAAADISSGAPSNWRKRKKIPDGSIARVATHTNVRFEWLKTGEGEMRPGEHSATNETQSPYGNGLDRELAGEIVSFLFDIANELGVTLNPEKAKDLFFIIHDEFAKTQQIDRAKVIQLVRLAA